MWHVNIFQYSYRKCQSIFSKSVLVENVGSITEDTNRFSETLSAGKVCYALPCIIESQFQLNTLIDFFGERSAISKILYLILKKDKCKN